MPWKFNPFTGALDQTVSGGGGSSVIEGEVDTYNDLPLDGSAALNSSWLVRTASGSWFTGGSKPAGIYVRINTAGSSRDNDYVYAGLLPSAFSDSELKIYDQGDSTKTAQFQLSGIATGQNRVVSLPDKNITLDDSGDSRTPTAHAASHGAAGSDPIEADSLASTNTGAANALLIADGNGGTSWDLAANVFTQEVGPADIGAADASHTHGNITNDGKLGSTSGLPLVTTTSGAITTLALGSAGQVLKVNSGGTAVEFGAAGGVTSGSVDNAIIRADGTGGSTVQSSALILSDFSNSTQETVAISASVAGFSVTANASTDVFTAVGHNFVANQQVAFTSLTGGSGVDTTRPYYVRDISGDTFKLSFSRGTGALNITTDITAGTIVSAVGLVLRPQGFGGIMTAIPDGTSANGNSRGYDAVDLCNYRTGATQVASGLRSALLGGERNLASGNQSAVVGGNLHQATGSDSFIGSGIQNTASGGQSAIIGGNQNTSSGAGSIAVGGFQNQATAENAFAFGRQALANRIGLMAHGTQNFAAIGDSQRIRAVLSNKTTNATATELFLNGTSASSRLAVPSGKVMAMLINITGVKSDGSAVAHYVRQYAIKNVAGTTSEVYAAVTVGTDNAAGTSINVSFNDSTVDALKLEVTGIASETWRWVASVDAVEVAYGT